MTDNSVLDTDTVNKLSNEYDKNVDNLVNKINTDYNINIKEYTNNNNNNKKLGIIICSVISFISFLFYMITSSSIFMIIMILFLLISIILSIILLVQIQSQKTETDRTIDDISKSIEDSNIKSPNIILPGSRSSDIKFLQANLTKIILGGLIVLIGKSTLGIDLKIGARLGVLMGKIFSGISFKISSEVTAAIMVRFSPKLAGMSAAVLSERMGLTALTRAISLLIKDSILVKILQRLAAMLSSRAAMVITAVFSVASISVDIADPRKYFRAFSQTDIDKMMADVNKGYSDSLKTQGFKEPVIMGPLNIYSSDQINKAVGNISKQMLENKNIQGIFMSFIYTDNNLEDVFRGLINKYIPLFNATQLANFNKMVDLSEKCGDNCDKDEEYQKAYNQFIVDLLTYINDNNDTVLIDSIRLALNDKSSKIVEYMTDKIMKILCDFPEIIPLVDPTILFNDNGDVISINGQPYPSQNAGELIINPVYSTQDNIIKTCSYTKTQCSYPRPGQESQWINMKEKTMKTIENKEGGLSTDPLSIAGYTEYVYLNNYPLTPIVYKPVNGQKGYCKLSSPIPRLLCTDFLGANYNESLGKCTIDERYCKKMGQQWKKDDKGVYDCILPADQFLGEAATGMTLLRDGNASSDYNRLEHCKSNEITDGTKCFQCPADHPNYNNTTKDCWNTCPEGYSLQPGTLDCYQNCTDGMTDMGATCDPKYGNGAGTSPFSVLGSSVCSDPIGDYNCKNCSDPTGRYSTDIKNRIDLGDPNNWQAAVGLCFPKCAPGYTNTTINYCKKPCPPGFRDDGNLCWKNRIAGAINSVPKINERTRKNIVGVGLSGNNILMGGTEISWQDQSAEVCGYTKMPPSELPNNILQGNCWRSYSPDSNGNCNGNDSYLLDVCWKEERYY
jgi:hypothetical protein